MFERKLSPIIVELLNEFRIVYLTGPRQAGKTTLARTIAQEMGLYYLSFDNQSVLQSAKTDPAGFIQAFGDKKLILDEFQYVPELIPAIKEVSDNLAVNEKGKFLLTGSADIFRSAKTQESLPGHMARLELYPLSLSERSNSTCNMIDFLCAFDVNFSKNLVSFKPQELAALIIQGGYPEVQTKSIRAKEIWYKSYLEGRLFKDFEVLYATRGDYRSKLQALLHYLAGLSSNLLKYANIANDLGQEDKVVKAYIEILELMFFIKRIPGYLKNRAKRQAISLAKLQMIDTGLSCNLLGIRNENQLISSPHYGGLLENFIFMELQKQNTWANEQVEFYHFRDKYQHEVDIVLERSSQQIIGIEIKASSTVKAQDFKGLIKLAEFNPKEFQFGIIFYSGKEILSFSHQQIPLYALPLSLFL
jgi:predicted AAA+ superfamily ATPase